MVTPNEAKNFNAFEDDEIPFLGCNLDLDWEKIAPEVAVQILGEPSKKDGSYYRWGSKGSLALNLEQGTFFDFENNQGYGLIEFIKNNGFNPDDFLKSYEPVKSTKPAKIIYRQRYVPTQK